MVGLRMSLPRPLRHNDWWGPSRDYVYVYVCVCLCVYVCVYVCMCVCVCVCVLD
jgi:hypothetical protein